MSLAQLQKARQVNNIFKLILDFISLLLKSFGNSNKAPLPVPHSQPLITVPATSSTEVFTEKAISVTRELIDIFKINLPPITNTSLTGTEFVNSIMNVLPNQQREDLIFEQFKLGNLPNFMRTPVEVTVTDGSNTLKYTVLPEVLCVGTDEDYLRAPLNPLTARKVADMFNCVLPTTKMCKQIWQDATIKLEPSPNGPPYTEIQQTTPKLWEQEQRIRSQMASSKGQLVSGHKKDVVLSSGLLSHLQNVAIYGWFKPDGSPIQNLNCVSHSNTYKDYSHGIRMVSRIMFLNGEEKDFYDMLSDVNLNKLISSEGPYDAKSIYKS